jgi:hypothetical protein
LELFTQAVVVEVETPPPVLAVLEVVVQVQQALQMPLLEAPIQAGAEEEQGIHQIRLALILALVVQVL